LEGIKSFLTYITSGVSFSHPGFLLVIFGLAAVNEIGFPLFFTLEILLFFISYQYGPLSSQSLLILIVLLLGRELGANALYFAARGLGGRFLDWLEKRSSRTMRAIEKFKTRLNNHPTIMVALVRITPGLLQVPSVAAGAIRLRISSFIEGVGLSSLIDDVIVILLGFSARFFLTRMNTQPKTYLFASFCCLIALVWVALLLLYRRNVVKSQRQKERIV
jgi:membrane protein DedA with SNARE-associated domain